MPPSLEIHLEIFEGPLDLLLFLIKKDDLDIHNIPISLITREYLDYIQMMKDLNLDLAGEFLVIQQARLARSDQRTLCDRAYARGGLWRRARRARKADDLPK